MYTSRVPVSSIWRCNLASQLSTVASLTGTLEPPGAAEYTHRVSAGEACVPNTSKFVSFVRALYINFMQID